MKSAAAILLTVVLILTVGRQEKDIAAVLAMIACCMTSVTALTLLKPVLSFLYELEEAADLSSGVVTGLLKIVGIGLVSEIAALICQDAGTASLGKGLQLLGSAAILCLSMPVFESLTELLRQILGGL